MREYSIKRLGVISYFLDKGKWEILRVASVYLMLLILYPLLFRILGDELFGVLKIWEGVLLQIVVFTSGGLGAALIQKHSKYNRQEKKTIFISALVVVFIMTLIVIIVLLVIAYEMNSLFGDDDFFMHAIAFSFILFFLGFQSIGIQWLNSQLDIRRISISVVAMNAIKLLAVPFAYIWGFYGVVFALGLSAIFSTLISFKGLLKTRVFSMVDITVIFPFANAAIFMTLATLATSAMKIGDRYILGAEMGSKEVATMFIVLSVASLFAEPVRLMSSLLLPYVCDRENINSFSSKKLRVYMLLVIPTASVVFFIGWFFGGHLILFFYGEKMLSNSEGIFNYCMLAISLGSFYPYFRGFIIRFCSARMIFFMTFITSFVYILSAIFFVRLFGFIGISYALIISYGLQALFSLILFNNMIIDSSHSDTREISL